MLSYDVGVVLLVVIAYFVASPFDNVSFTLPLNTPVDISLPELAAAVIEQDGGTVSLLIVIEHVFSLPALSVTLPDIVIPVVSVSTVCVSTLFE